MRTAGVTAPDFDAPDRLETAAVLSRLLRERIRALADTAAMGGSVESNLLNELAFIVHYQHVLAPAFRNLKARRVLYPGQCYYYHWYLSRRLRELGWKADLLDWDTNPASRIFYHGRDFLVGEPGLESFVELLEFYLNALYEYDVFHFANSRGILFCGVLQQWFAEVYGRYSEIYLLKSLSKVIVYTNNGCLDGVSQAAFSRWGPQSVCASCRWQEEPDVCSDERNLEWGLFRNSVADYQCLLGGNRADFNVDPRIHESPEVYCLEPDIWNPELSIPEKYRFQQAEPGTIFLYHAVGNREQRTRNDGENVKSTHIYLPLVEKLQKEGVPVELVSPSQVPNLEVRFIQMQCHIVLEMLTYGWYGTNVREAMMLGKPVICFIRDEWLSDVRREIPEYAAELPIVSATPDTVERELRRLISSPNLRESLGQQARAFSVKWHSSTAAARRFDAVYRGLLTGERAIGRAR